MIIGLGIDIADQIRIHDGIKKHGDKFLQRIFTAPEIASCQPYRYPVEHYAGKFAVKEAFMKAIGTGLTQNVTFKDIEVLNRDSGAPYVTINAIKLRINSFSFNRIFALYAYIFWCSKKT